MSAGARARAAAAKPGAAEEAEAGQRTEQAPELSRELSREPSREPSGEPSGEPSSELGAERRANALRLIAAGALAGAATELVGCAALVLAYGLLEGELAPLLLLPWAAAVGLLGGALYGSGEALGRWRGVALGLLVALAAPLVALASWFLLAVLTKGPASAYRLAYDALSDPWTPALSPLLLFAWGALALHGPLLIARLRGASLAQQSAAMGAGLFVWLGTLVLGTWTFAAAHPLVYLAPLLVRVAGLPLALRLGERLAQAGLVWLGQEDEPTVPTPVLRRGPSRGAGTRPLWIAALLSAQAALLLAVALLPARWPGLPAEALRRAARCFVLGDTEDLFQVARQLDEGGGFWGRGAQVGLPHGLRALGGAGRRGQVLEPDAARHVYRLAAERGHQRAMLAVAQLAFLYDERDEGLRWLRRAARSGEDLELILELAGILRWEARDAGDVAEARAWCERAAVRGHETARFWLARWDALETFEEATRYRELEEAARARRAPAELEETELEETAARAD